jgi:excisionase family DNA binding protein
MESLVSIKTAAACLGCSEAMLRKWIQLGRLSTIKVGRLTRLRQSDLDAWLRVGLSAVNGKGKEVSTNGN